MYFVDEEDNKTAYHYTDGDTFEDWIASANNVDAWQIIEDKMYSKDAQVVMYSCATKDKIVRYKEYRIGNVKIIDNITEQDYIVHMPDTCTIVYSEAGYDGNICIKDLDNVKLITLNGSNEDFYKYENGKYKYYSRSYITDNKWECYGYGDATKVEQLMPEFLYEWGDPKSYLRKYCYRTEETLELAGQTCHKYKDYDNPDIYYYLNDENIVFKMVVDGQHTTVTGFSYCISGAFELPED